MYVNLIKTNSKSKLNDNTMAKKQKSSAEPTPLLDSAAARLVKITFWLVEMLLLNGF